MRPIRAAIRGADSEDSPASRLAAKKIAPSMAGWTPKRQVEPVGDEALGDEAAGKAVDGEQERTVARRCPSTGRGRAGAGSGLRSRGHGGRFDGRTDATEDHRHAQPDQGIADDDGAIGVDGGDAAIEQRLRHEPGRERSDGRRDVARRGCTRRTSRVRRAPGVASVSAACSTARNGPTSLPVGLITPMVAARIRSGTQIGNREHETRQDHQERPSDQDPAPAKSIGTRREPERDQRVADEGQGQDDPDRGAVEAERGEVQDQDDGQEAIARTSAGSGS